MKTNLQNSASVIILMVITLFTGSVLYAQPGQGQRGGQQGPPAIPNTKQIKVIVSDLAKEVSLTSVQQASVQKLYTEHFAVVKAKTSGNSKPKREEMEALKTKLEKEIKTLLTSDQQVKYKAYLKKSAKKQPRR
jgi:hypothetical protein